MNEILVRKYVKSVVKYGIPKHKAIEIVEASMRMSKGGNVELAINYAIDLTYGLGFSTKAK